MNNQPLPYPVQFAQQFRLIQLGKGRDMELTKDGKSYGTFRYQSDVIKRIEQEYKHFQEEQTQ